MFATVIRWILFALTMLGCSSAPSLPPDPSDAGSASARSPGGTDGLPLPAGTEAVLRTIDADLLRGYTTTIGGDAFEGRGPGSPGDAAARRWLAETLASLGYAPAGPDGRWEQPVPIVGITSAMPEAWSFSAKGGKRLAMRWADDYIAWSGAQRERVAIDDAELVFVGYGIDAPEQGWNDFGTTDLTGKLLLVLNDDPDWDPELFAGPRRLYYGRWTYKYEEAARRGAAGALIIHTDASAGYPWTVVQSSWGGEQFELPQGREPRLGVRGWLTKDAATRLVALAGRDLASLVEHARKPGFEPVPLGIRTSLAFSATMRRTETANVLGRLNGSDPELGEQVVVYTAHHDHFGIGQPAGDGDRIYNGARDNGTGIAQALGVAKAIAALPSPPRRSVMVAFVGGEEQGLLGSKYFAEEPPLDLRHVVANINFELGNIWGPTHDVVIHGKGKTSLDRFVELAAARQQRTVHDERNPNAGWFYRSDQFSFARVGIPAIWFESGLEFVGRPPGWGQTQVADWIAEHYHQPSDEVTPDWNFEGMVADAQLAVLVGLAVATADSVPGWNEGDEFAGRRRSPDAAELVP